VIGGGWGLGVWNVGGRGRVLGRVGEDGREGGEKKREGRREETGRVASEKAKRKEKTHSCTINK